jgi:hypothetical protein
VTERPLAVEQQPRVMAPSGAGQAEGAARRATAASPGPSAGAAVRMCTGRRDLARAPHLIAKLQRIYADVPGDHVQDEDALIPGDPTPDVSEERGVVPHGESAGSTVS